MRANIPQMKDPFGSMQGFLNQFRGFAQNPMQFFAQNKLSLPQGMNPMQDPQGAIQYLMNNGAMSQEQYNQLAQVAQRIQQDPMFSQMFGQR